MLHSDVLFFAVTWGNVTMFEKEIDLALYSEMLCTSTVAEAAVMLYRFSSSQVSKSIIISKWLFGTCCTMAPTQGLWDTRGYRTFGKTCAANTSEKSVKMRGHHSPIFCLLFIGVISQYWQCLFISIAHSDQSWSLKQCYTLNSDTPTCPLPSPDPESLHTLLL